MSDTKNSPDGKGKDFIPEQDETGEHSSSPKPTRATVESPPATQKIYAASRKHENNFQKWLEWIPPDVSLWISVAALFVSLGSCYGSHRSATIAKMALIVNQRPAVHLGLPDGKIATFVSVEGKEQIALYFRNYGHSTARITVIETWPVILDTTIGATSGVQIPPPEERDDGPDLPPDFPYVYYWSVPGVTRVALAKGEKNLIIIGRIRYADSFRQYCDVFTIRYARERTSEFALQRGHTIGSFDPCDTDAAYIASFVVVDRDYVVAQDNQNKKQKERAEPTPEGRRQ